MLLILRKTFKRYLGVLKSKIDHLILVLSKVSGPPFAIFGALLTGPGDVDAQVFLSLLQSIKTNNQANFLYNMSCLAEKLPANRRGVFVGNFVTLFVLKEFSSNHYKRFYAHSFLRCGEIIIGPEAQEVVY